MEQAKKATETSYAPYSKFNVGAAVLLENGETISGSNQENAAFPSGTCAERTTIFYASARFPGVRFCKLAIAAFTDGEFVEEKKNIMLKFRGSENQRIIDVKKSLEQNETVIYSNNIANGTACYGQLQQLT